VVLGDRPRGIALIDGWIHDRPAVGHKEILFALAEGVMVFGAGGIGAIRAVELHHFGMRGVGQIYNAYAEGLFDGDDEVAVATCEGTTAVSVALVDVRATLQAAVKASVIDRDLAVHLLTAARSLHYSERNYSRILEVSRHDGVSETGIDSFGRWLPPGAQSAKEEDARQVIEALAEALQQEQTMHQSCPRPTDTAAWRALYEQVAEEMRRS
jgi:hypothetical protein